MEKEYDNRKIIIREYSNGLDHTRGHQIKDVKIILYNYSFENEKYYFNGENNKKTEDGYIIEAKIKAVRKPLIKRISKDLFECFYNKIIDFDFNEIAMAGAEGNDGGGFEMEIGTFNKENTFQKKLVLWTPFISSSFCHNIGNVDLLNALYNVIDEIKKEINFSVWYNKNYKEWKNWENKINEYYKLYDYNGEIAQYSIDT